MRHRILAVLLALAMLISLVPQFTSTADAANITGSGTFGKDDSLTWTLANGILTISGTGEMLDNETPWQNEPEWIAAVIIEDGVTYIGDGAFGGFRMNSVIFPDSVTAIGQALGCYVKSVWLLASITSIDNNIFTQCDSLKNIYYAGTHEQWNQLTATVTVPSRATIHYNADDRISGAVGMDASWTLSRDGTLTISGSGEMFDYKYNGFVDIPWEDFTLYIRSLVISDQITHIGNYAFEYLPISTVSLPSNLRSIGYGAFSGCSQLEEITLPNRITTIEPYTFADCRSFTEIVLPSELTTMASSHFELVPLLV